MPSFRSDKSQAKHALDPYYNIGSPRHENYRNGEINGLGTNRTFNNSLSVVINGIYKTKGLSQKEITPEIAHEFLVKKLKVVSQNTLDAYRRSLEISLQVSLERIITLNPHSKTPCIYTNEQIQLISQRQNPKNSISTEIATDGGLRAHELLTLLPEEYRKLSSHRVWSNKRFKGRKGYKIYTVIGKGGLVREVTINNRLSDLLESRRLANPIEVIDRGIKYIQYYDIGGGQSWSQSFTDASKRALGWSLGAHNLRHRFAMKRVENFLKEGLAFKESVLLTSQELGHFRETIIKKHYLNIIS